MTETEWQDSSAHVRVNQAADSSGHGPSPQAWERQCINLQVYALSTVT